MTITELKQIARDARRDVREYHDQVFTGPRFSGGRPPRMWVAGQWINDPSVCEREREPVRMCAARYVALTRVGAGMCMSCQAVDEDCAHDSLEVGPGVCSVCGEPSVCGLEDATLVGEVAVL